MKYFIMCKVIAEYYVFFLKHYANVGFQTLCKD